MHLDRARASTTAVLFSAALVIGASMCTVPASAQDAKGGLEGMLSHFGVKVEKDEEAIDYRPRAPLVVPPSRNLPAPQEAVRDPAWPKDPGIDAQRRAALDSRRPAPQANPPSRPEPAPKEQQAGPAKPDEHEGECLLNDTGPRSCLRVFRTFFGADEADKPKSGEEPTRKLLTEPPAGYRTAAVAPKSADDKPKPQAETGGLGGILRMLGIGRSDED